MAIDRVGEDLSVHDLTAAAGRVPLFTVVFGVWLTSIAHLRRVLRRLAYAQALPILQPVGRSWP